jgi:DNA-binding transcriptional LysR family regulator
MDAEILFDDRQVVVAGAKSKWARQRSIALSALIRESWILPPLDTIIGSQIASAFRSAGIQPPRPQIESFSVPLCHRLVATGRFITMLPVSMVTLSKHLPLKFLRLESPVVPRPTGIIALKNRTRGALAELFIDRARKLAKSLARRG